MMLHTYTPDQCPYHISGQEPGQVLRGQGHYSKVKGQIKVTHLWLHTYTPQQMPLPPNNLLYLTVCEI